MTLALGTYIDLPPLAATTLLTFAQAANVEVGVEVVVVVVVVGAVVGLPMQEQALEIR
jgi:hypothetical protein